MYYPTYEEVRQLCDSAMDDQSIAESLAATPQAQPLLPLYCDILADMETPISAYCKTAQRPYSFLLESVTGGEHIARYSFIGIDPYMVMTHRGEEATLYKIQDGHNETIPSTTIETVPCYDPLTLVEAELGRYRLVTPPRMEPNELPKFYGGAVGYLSYDAVARFEHLPVPEQNTLDLPLAVFCFTETVLAFDHVKHRVRIITHLHLDKPDLAAEYRRGCAVIEDVQRRLRSPVCLPQEPEVVDDPEALRVTSNRTQEAFEEMVHRSKIGRAHV